MNPGTRYQHQRNAGVSLSTGDNRFGGKESWTTQLELTKDDFKNRDPFPLSKFPASELDVGGGLPIVGQPRLGDYLHLLAMGKDLLRNFLSEQCAGPVAFSLWCDFSAP